jgi:ubiquinone/menaquinone biosynthesis C-methylase UbiE
MTLERRLAIFLMKSGNTHARFGAQDCYTPDFIRPGNDSISVATQRAFDDGPSFFHRFEGTVTVEDLRGKDVLDIGSGCGGRTAFYLLEGSPKSIIGLDISVLRAGVAKTSVQRLCNDTRISFMVGIGEEMPFQDGSFDVILSYDVFEHVQDLTAVLKECFRILRPAGRLIALFPPYYGPRAHHLDFVTTLPFLHHLFSPSALVDAANTILQEKPWLRDNPLPPPSRSYLGKEVLPRLNGTTERDFREILRETSFQIEQFTLLAFGWGKGGVVKKFAHRICKTMLQVPLPFARDLFVSTIRCVLRKEAR